MVRRKGYQYDTASWPALITYMNQWFAGKDINMTAVQIVLGSLDILSAVAFIGVGVPMAMRKIPMNRWCGIKIRKAFQSEALWYDINAYGGRQFIIWALPILAAGVACFFVPLHEASPAPLILGLTIVPITVFTMVTIVRTLSYAKRR